MQFRLGPFPVAVQPSFFVLAVLLASSRLGDPLGIAQWVVVVFVSVLAHELGHALAYRGFGQAARIELYIMGGLTYGAAGLPPMRSVAVSLAGPAMGFAVGVLAWGLSSSLGHPAPGLLQDILWVNIGWSVLNLVPIWPLDGAQALRGLIALVAPGSADVLVLGLSVALAGAFGVAALAGGSLWLAFLCLWFGSSSARNLGPLLRRGPDRELTTDLRRAHALLEAERWEQALAVAESVRARAQRPKTRADAGELAGWAHLGAGRPERALSAAERLERPAPILRGRALLRIPHRRDESVEPLLAAFAARPSEDLGAELAGALIELERLDEAARLVLSGPGATLGAGTQARVETRLFEADRLEQALEVADRRFERTGAADAAYNAACAAARLGAPDEALRRLQRAVKAGFDGFDYMGADPDLAAVRELPGYAALRPTSR